MRSNRLGISTKKTNKEMERFKIKEEHKHLFTTVKDDVFYKNKATGKYQPISGRVFMHNIIPDYIFTQEKNKGMDNDLKQKAESRTSDYVCVPCGIQYLTEKQKRIENISTFHLSICGLCGREESVTDIRAYNYLTVQKK